MTTKDLVSIIIPVYNRANLIAQTLESVLAQDYKQWECIVVDDGSTDSSKAVARQFADRDPRFSLFTRPDDLTKGANSCRNFGFKKTNGEFILWFDSDDIMNPDDLSTRMVAMKGKDVVVTSAEIVDDNLNPLGKFRIERGMDLYRTYAYTKTEMITNSVLFRKDFLKDKKLFDPKVVRGQEAEFFLRIFRDVADDRFEILDYIGFRYRQHKDTKSEAAKQYRSDYKQAQLGIFADNLNFARQIQDRQLMIYLYKQIVPIVVQAAANRDIKTLKAAKASLYKVFGSKNKGWKLQLTLGSNLLYLLGRGSYRFQRKMLHAKLNLD